MIHAIRAASLVVLFGVAALHSPVSAHVTLDTPQALAKAYTRVAIRVPHGCDGAPTVGLRVQIPDGITSVKPMPKTGWDLTIVREEASSTTPAATGGHDSGPVVREVTWRGGPLPDAFFEEFVLSLRMPDAPDRTLWFLFIQECEGGKTTRWIEKPNEGQGIDQLRHPGYPVRVLPRP